MQLLTSNAKLKKCREYGYHVVGLQFASYDRSGYQVCPMADLAGCAASCLDGAGHGRSPIVIQARVERTRLFKEDVMVFAEQFEMEMEKHIRKAERQGLKLAVRPNVFSDIPWESEYLWDGLNMFDRWPGVQFYDYTKLLTRWGRVPKNYDLTLSYSTYTEKYLNLVKRMPRLGMPRWSVVFHKQLPETFRVYREYLTPLMVIDGDQHDLTFLYPGNVVLGLLEKRTRTKAPPEFSVRIES